jgi:hypothetical protein
MPRSRLSLILATTLFSAGFLSAGSPVSLHADEPLHVRIDQLIAAKTPEYAKLAAPLASDGEFLRRVTLDLTGMIPTTADARAFLADTSPDKRTKLIDKLLASPEYARHMQRVADVVLMRRLAASKVSAAEWQTFLRTSFAENKPWDKLAHEILSNDGSDIKNRGPARFYLDRNVDINAVTLDIGRVFLGTDIECAQCHDHPEFDDYKQADYYGIQAFLVRSALFTDPKTKKAMIAEKAVGEVSFLSVFAPKDKKTKPNSILPTVFGEKLADEPKFEKGQEYKVKPAKNVRSIPKFSRFALLADAVTSPKNRRFTRTAANRFWGMMLGRGLVHPVDRDHSDNPPSHPELLELLADELAAHKFDIKWYLRELALTQTYQRSSRYGAADTKEIPEETFVQAVMKPLSPAQLAWAMLQASGEADVHRKSLGAKLTEAALAKRLVGTENRFVSLFGGPAGQAPQDFETTVDQVLFVANDPTMIALTKTKAGNLADRIAKLPADDTNAIAEELFFSVLTRKPTSEDIADVKAHLSQPMGTDRPALIQELVWALLASSEFRFNH